MSNVRMTTGCPVERLDHAAIGAVLLFLVGHGRAADDEELGAHQPDALGAAARRQLGLLRQVDVRAQRDAHAVGRDRPRAARAARELRLVARSSRSARSRIRLDLVVRRVDDEHPGRAVEHPRSRRRAAGVVASRSPTTAGRPSDRARIATCDVRVPASVAIAAIASRSSCTVRLGVRSCVTRIAFAPFGTSTGSWSGRSEQHRQHADVDVGEVADALAQHRRRRAREVLRATRASRGRTPSRRRGSAGCSASTCV